MSKVIGIDLGTTNSCVAVMINKQPAVIANKAGYRITPSYFAITKDNKKLVGNLAKRQAVINPENTVFAFKRLIGRRFDSHEVQVAQKSVAYHLVNGPNDDVRISIAGKDYSIPEVSAMILIEMKKVAEEYLSEEVKEAVITVPAYFNDNQRQATKDAGKIAGLDVLRIINEPTAAAIAYGLNRHVDNEKVLIYDFGGGTFDVSILEIHKGVFEVISTSGDTYLGGEDIDNRLIQLFIKEIQDTLNVDLGSDRMALQRLKEAAEKTKIELSGGMESMVNLPFIAYDKTGPRHYTRRFTRHELEQHIEDIVDKTIGIVKQAIGDARLNTTDINEIILVGGQTRMPLIMEKVKKFFGRASHRGVNPDEVVAIGAAIDAVSLTAGSNDMLLLDVTPLSLGIETHGGEFAKIIDKNTTVPVKKSHIFTTSYDNQSAVRIRVFQGESATADENELLGEFILSGIRMTKKGEPRIEVSFDIDNNGIVNVSAVDLDTGLESKIEIVSSSKLTEEEIKAMSDEAHLYEVDLRDE
ncbi:MAG: molecular chaperone DnaK [Deltaproteobacteria bacterium]|nr:molecular chaperone DnaK [Deltaproteobacteria bacterium]